MAREFNNIDTWITYSNITAYDITSAISCSAWIFPDNVTNHGGIIAKTDGSIWDFDFYISAEGFLSFFDDTIFDGSPAADTQISAGVWQHVAITWDGSTLRFFLNGVADGTTAGSGSLPNNQHVIEVGRDGDWNGIAEFDGGIAEPAFFNRALTAGEISGLASGPCPLFFARGLVFYSPLIGRVSPEPEFMFGNTGTVTNATQFAHPPTIIYQSRPFIMPELAAAAGGGRIMSSLVASGGLAGPGGIAGPGGGLAA